MAAAFQAVNVDGSIDYDYERGRWAPLGITLAVRPSRTEEALIAACADADAIIGEFTATPFTRRVLTALPRRCRLIVKYSVGVDNIDVSAATELGIVVANSADYCTEEVSDHALALILASGRRILTMDHFVREGRWAGFSKAYPLRRMSELTVGLIGMGRIARATARKLGGFRMKVVATDPVVPVGTTVDGVEIVPLAEVLRQADFVSVHVPLTPQTRGMINAAVLGAMKPTAILVNTSRGPVVDEPALIAALREHRLGVAALDVVAAEPLAADSPLRHFDSVILTPHTGAESAEALQQARRTVADSVAAVCQGRWPTFPVNRQVIPRFPLVGA